MAYIPNRPGEDEFDRIYREARLVPGIFLYWVVVVRSWRWARRRLTEMSRR